MRRVRITLGYDGTDFHGSQVQPGVRTVQEELERAIQRVASGSSRATLAGRTDRGVHAIGQVASVDVRWSRALDELRTALDAITPCDLVVRTVDSAPAGFHARHDARWREYRYRLRFAHEPPILNSRYVWWRRGDIDHDAAGRACSQFIGTHAFGAFASHGWSQAIAAASMRRTIRNCSWHRVDRWDAGRHTIEVEFRVTASGFLPQMVRNMVSSVMAVAAGRQPESWIGELLMRGDRRELGEPAPAHGLTLWRVEYDNDARTEPHGITTFWEYEGE